MANIARFDPFFEPFEDLMRRFSGRFPAEVRNLPAQIKLDVEEQDTAYVVTAEIPGVRKEDISVDLDGNVVTIRAESKAEREEKKRGRVVRSERYYGSLYRSFALGTDVDESKAQATYADGILTLTLPKKTNGRAKRLTIN
jgi:HSP20 family protein